MNTLCAIPTEFNGVAYRSRLEADTARLLTLLQIPFEYEAKSYLLPTGIHFRPDFILHGGSQVIEVRGYESAHGDQQLRDFSQFVAGGGLGDGNTLFAVLSERHVVDAVHAVHNAPYLRGALWSPEWSFRHPQNKGIWGAVICEDIQQDCHLGWGWLDESEVSPVVDAGVLCLRHRNGADVTPVREISTLAEMVAL